MAKERLTYLSDLNFCHWGEQINHFIHLLLQELLRAIAEEPYVGVGRQVSPSDLPSPHFTESLGTKPQPP